MTRKPLVAWSRDSALAALFLAGLLSAAATRAAVVDLPGLGPFEIAYDATNPAEQVNPNADFRGADGVNTRLFPEIVSDIFYVDETPNANDLGYLRTAEGPFGGAVLYHFRPTEGLFDGTFRITTRADLNDAGRVVGQATDRSGNGVQFFDTDTDMQGDPDETGQFVDTTVVTLPDAQTDLFIRYFVLNPAGGTAGSNGVRLFASDNQEDSTFLLGGTIVFPEPGGALAVLALTVLGLRPRK